MANLMHIRCSDRDDFTSSFNHCRQPIFSAAALELFLYTRFFSAIISAEGRGEDVQKRIFAVDFCRRLHVLQNTFLPVYTFDYRCKEDPDILLGDEATKVIINATGNRTGLSDEMAAFLDFILTGKGSSNFTHRLEAAVNTAKTHKEWEVEYMTLYAKIQEEREEAAINQIIKTCRKHGISDADIITDIITEFHLTKEEALDFINEYDKQLV